MRQWTVLAVITGVLILSSITLAAEQKGKAPDDLKAQIKALQKERIETLARLVEVCSAQYRVGANTFLSVLGAQDELVSAQLDATDKPEERVALLTNQVKIATDVLEVVQSHEKTARATQADVCRAQSHLLDIKIKLLRERGRLSPE
jgi:outer membrane protein TolC